MKIEPLEFLAYQVTGQEGVYRVCLEENDFFGHCSCAHFAYRVQPALNRGERPWPCKHLVLARMTAWSEIAPLLAKHWNKQK